MTNNDVELIASLLKQFSPGFLPYPVFEQIARLVALPIIELVPLRQNGNTVEVLLLKRPDDDPHWPGLLHSPGTVIRATDLNSSQPASSLAFERIIKDELENTPVSQPHYVGSLLHDSKRGVEQAQLYWAEVTSRPLAGQFYGADDLPADLIEPQVDFINQAVNDFKEFKKIKAN